MFSSDLIFLFLKIFLGCGKRGWFILLEVPEVVFLHIAYECYHLNLITRNREWFILLEGPMGFIHVVHSI